MKTLWIATTLFFRPEKSAWIERLSRSAHPFATATAGAIAPLFGVLLMVIIPMAGLGLDYGLATNAQTKAQTASDSAVLAGVKRASRARAKGDTDWKAQGIAEARAFFAANTSRMHFNFTPTVDVAIETIGSNLKGTLNYTFKRPTVLMRVVGITETNIGGTATAATAIGSFIDINFVVDNSQSMGIGAETSDQIRMYNANGCAFACHIFEGAAGVVPNSMPQVVRASPVNAKLRIDVAREAMAKVVRDLQAKSLETDQVRISITTFSVKSKVILPLTADLNAALTAVNTLDLHKADTLNEVAGATVITNSIAQVAARLPPSGGGTSRTDRRSYVVLLTDGIEDANDFFANQPAINGHFGYARSGGLPPGWISGSPSFDAGDGPMQPFSNTACKPLKDKGHYVMPLRIKYVAPYGATEPWNILKIFFVQITASTAIAKAFENCATDPKDVVTASTSSEIQPAFSKILNDILNGKGVRLTN